MRIATLSLFLILFVSACSHKAGNTATSSTTTGTPQFSIAASDVSTASIQIATNTPNLVAAHKTAVVDVQFSIKAAADFQKFTQEHLHQKIQILVGSKVVLQPVVESVISSGELELPFSTPEEAQAVADTLNKR
ncbi:MAG TPA: hypothetical protein VIK59_06320 [Verrucomicrobiae bacterium]